MTGPKRRRRRFSLRTLFVAVSICGCAFGFALRAVRLEARAKVHQDLAVHSLAQKIAMGASQRPFMSDNELAQIAQKRQSAFAQWERQTATATNCRRAIWRPWIEPQTGP